MLFIFFTRNISGILILKIKRYIVLIILHLSLEYVLEIGIQHNGLQQTFLVPQGVIFKTYWHWFI